MLMKNVDDWRGSLAEKLLRNVCVAIYVSRAICVALASVGAILLANLFISVGAPQLTEELQWARIVSESK